MEKLFNWISIVFGIIGGGITYWLGGWDLLLKTILALAVLDYFTGIIKGVRTKSLSSEIGFGGLLKKIVMFILIAAAFAVQNLMNDAIPLREVVIMFYIANEGLSLLENAAMFISIPQKLKDVLLQLRDKDYTNIDIGERVCRPEPQGIVNLWHRLLRRCGVVACRSWPMR